MSWNIDRSKSDFDILTEKFTPENDLHTNRSQIRCTIKFFQLLKFLGEI